MHEQTSEMVMAAFIEKVETKNKEFFGGEETAFFKNFFCCCVPVTLTLAH